MGEEGLTAEQKARIEQNRIQALERLKQRQLRLEQEQKHLSQPPAAPGPASSYHRPLEAKRPATKRPEHGPRESIKVEMQLDTPTTFCIAASTPTLHPLCRSIPGAVYLQEDNVWRLPLPQYPSLRTTAPWPQSYVCCW